MSHQKSIKLGSFDAFLPETNESSQEWHQNVTLSHEPKYQVKIDNY